MFRGNFRGVRLNAARLGVVEKQSRCIGISESNLPRLVFVARSESTSGICVTVQLRSQTRARNSSAYLRSIIAKISASVLFKWLARRDDRATDDVPCCWPRLSTRYNGNYDGNSRPERERERMVVRIRRSNYSESAKAGRARRWISRGFFQQVAPYTGQKLDCTSERTPREVEEEGQGTNGCFGLDERARG